MEKLQEEKIVENFNYEIDSVILNKIKRILLSRHPIVNDRLDYLFDKGEFDIGFNVYCDEGRMKTNIWFLDGKEYSRSSIQDTIVLSDKLSLNLLNSLITYILSDHEIISSLSTNYQTNIEMRFNVNIKDDTMKGISCRTIGLDINFYGKKNMSKYLEFYLKDIITVFFEKLKDTPFMKKEINKYVGRIKGQFLENCNEEDILELLSKLPVENLQKIIESLDANMFMELLQSETKDVDDNVKRIGLNN